MRTTLQKTILIALVVFFSISANSQDGPKGTVKLNLFGLAFRNINLQGEYAFHKNFSGCFGFNFMLPGKLPGAFPSASTEALESAGFKNFSVSGYSFTPELRFYPGKKDEHQAPHGFYLAPYFRYGKYTFKTDFDFTNEDTGNTDTYKSAFSYGGYGGGLMIGTQWLIGEHFSIDWYILGGHGGSGNVSISLTDPAIGDLSAEGKAELEKELAESGKNATVTISGDKATVKVKTPCMGFRMGLSLGFAF
ncbi:MAG: hypothetical protein A2046_11950 [Bacteroidetes bacterium GWA2_30_7]|nr:MAG: hypothetical protein A2046_11950 [Bacteroidetes bacterium GWA2_30_7]